MQTNKQQFWKREISSPMAAIAISLSLVASMAAYEYETGLPASIRMNPVYGSLPVHGAAPLPVIRKSGASSSIPMNPSIQKRLQRRLAAHRAAHAQ